MIRCNNCGTNNIDGSEYCDECGMRLDLSPPPRPRKRDAAPIYQPPSAVENEGIGSNTLDPPMPAPPSFTTSTSIPKPAMPARDRRHGDSRISNVNPRRNHTNERSGPAFKSNDARDHSVPPPAPQTYALSSPERTSSLNSDGASLQDRDGSRALARLIIERGGRIGKEFPIIGIETNIGRWDADSGIFPDVDLDEDDSEAKVSRRHARIVNHNSQFFIEDLGSTNGTFVNRGRRLLPGKRHMLQNGDEVIVGKTFLKFQILK
ncbi:MAG TPA: FHA domain-containing protein [Blastocatellia bacterium]|nr:FHA domain-containing protein [Blastocatellia bacterium]